MAIRGTDGSSLGIRLDEEGYIWPSAENLAGGQTTAQAVFDAWMANTGQRANMLASNMIDIGVGCRYNFNSTLKGYWTGVFGATLGIDRSV